MKTNLDEKGNIRFYVLANFGLEDQKSCIEQAHKAGYFAERIRPNCLELTLDNFDLLFEHSGEIVTATEYLSGKTRYAGIRPCLTLTTMSPDDIGYYYNWCPLECMWSGQPNLPMHTNILELEKAQEVIKARESKVREET